MSLKNFISLTTCVVLLSSHCFAEELERPDFLNSYDFHNSTQTFYKAFNTPATWQDAVKTCIDDGTSLLAPSSDVEFQILNDMRPADSDGTWVGVSDLFIANSYLTLEGVEPELLIWSEGNPKDTKERCVMMNKDKANENSDCSNLWTFVCAVPLHKVSTNVSNPECENQDRGYVYNSEGDRCYKFHTKLLTWLEAFETCKEEGSDLAVINSESEADYLAETMRNMRRSFSPKGSYVEKAQAHVGVSDLLVPGLFLTVDGRTPVDAGYEVWSDSSDTVGTEHCATYATIYEGYNQINCTDKFTFICEKVLKKNVVGAYFDSPFGPKKGEPSED